MPYEEIKECDECGDTFSGSGDKCTDCKLGYGPKGDKSD